MNKNVDENQILREKDFPEESEFIELFKVHLPKKWSFWEGYEVTNYSQVQKKDDWEKSIKYLFSFDDIITFWQYNNITIHSYFNEIFFDGTRIRK